MLEMPIVNSMVTGSSASELSSNTLVGTVSPVCLLLTASPSPQGDPGRRLSPPPRRGHRFSPPRNSEWRLIVRNLPPRAGWQDLKDFFREGGRVCFADVRRDRDGYEIGIVEFETRDDLENAYQKLQGQRLHGSALELIKDLPDGTTHSSN